MLTRYLKITEYKRRDSPEISMTRPSFETAGSNLWQDFSALVFLHKKIGLGLLPFIPTAGIPKVQNFPSGNYKVQSCPFRDTC